MTEVKKNQPVLSDTKQADSKNRISMFFLQIFGIKGNSCLTEAALACRSGKRFIRNRFTGSVQNLFHTFGLVFYKTAFQGRAVARV